jgi:hypothetical protein
VTPRTATRKFSIPVSSRSVPALTWTKLSPDHETAVYGARLWVLTRDHMAGMRNRWNLLLVYAQGQKSKLHANECPPGLCRRIASAYSSGSS